MNILKGQHWAVIPSRADSQRFPGKALVRLRSGTLIERAIETALMVQGINKVIVNTNDLKIKEYITAISSFPEAKRVSLYERSDALAQVNTRIDDTLISMIQSFNEVPEFIHLIQLTSPCTRVFDIEDAIEMLDCQDDFDSVQLITKVSNTNHAFSQRRMNQGAVEFCYPEEREKSYNSQLKPTYYVFAGYIGFRVESLLKYDNIWGKLSIGIIGHPECAIDIDTKEDLKFAEFYLRNKEEEVKYASGF